MLFQPLKIKKMVLKNRLVMAPMVTNFATPEGEVTDRLIHYYKERARGGVGLIILEASCVTPNGKSGPHKLGIYDDIFISGLEELVNVIHESGSKIAAQLHHGGNIVSPFTSGEYPVSASTIPCERIGAIPRSLTEKEIKELVKAFGIAAERAKRTGFDTVQIHAGHGYLINQFLSKRTNKRSDEYGGSLRNRMRFLLEILESIRERVGSDYPIMARINGKDFLEGGFGIEDSKLVAQELENASLDVLHVSGGTWDSLEKMLPPMYGPKGLLVNLAEQIKKNINIPVACVGRITDPIMAEEILEEGKADLITLGRALIADPEFPQKTLEGRLKDIRYCIGCNNCVDRLFSKLDINCSINPSMGFEGQFNISQAFNPKKVLIIGGGPAGLEAARTAALRKHEVFLYEKNSSLGGQLNLASIPAGAADIKRLIEYLVYQCEKEGVTIKLGVNNSEKAIDELKPDIVIFAVGASPKTPEIPGSKMSHVHTAHDVLAGKVTVNGKVIIIGGGLVGMETADFLANQGKDVAIIEMLEDVGLDAGFLLKKLLLERLNSRGVKIFVNTRAEAITSSGVVGSRSLGCHPGSRNFAADIIVLATGSKSNKDFLQETDLNNLSYFVIGDCLEPRKIINAIHEGSRTGREV